MSLSLNAPAAVVISVADREVGIAVRERGGFQFIAADPSFSVLDGSRFRRIDQVQHAASTLARVVGTPAAGTHTQH